MIHFISVNIETNRHLDRVKAFLERATPDVLCLQEVLQGDLPFLMKMVGPYLTWVPMNFLHGVQDVQGLAIISRYPVPSE